MMLIASSGWDGHLLLEVEAKTRNGTGGGTAERGDGTASNC